MVFTRKYIVHKSHFCRPVQSLGGPLVTTGDPFSLFVQILPNRHDVRNKEPERRSCGTVRPEFVASSTTKAKFYHNGNVTWSDKRMVGLHTRISKSSVRKRDEYLRITTGHNSCSCRLVQTSKRYKNVHIEVYWTSS